MYKPPTRELHPYFLLADHPWMAADPRGIKPQRLPRLALCGLFCQEPIPK